MTPLRALHDLEERQKVQGKMPSKEQNSKAEFCTFCDGALNEFSTIDEI
jgi:hypothetical protein